MAKNIKADDEKLLDMTPGLEDGTDPHVTTQQWLVDRR